MRKYQAFKIGGIFLLIVFTISGMWNVLYYEDMSFENPVLKFIYGGVFSIWDTIIALFLGAFLVWKYRKKD